MEDYNQLVKLESKHQRLLKLKSQENWPDVQRREHNIRNTFYQTN